MHRKIVSLFFAVFAVASALSAARAAETQAVPDEYQAVLHFLGRSGDYKDKVLKINIPRNDLEVTVAGRSTPTPFGFGGWAGITKGEGGMEVLMGDLVLLEDEVNPVMTALLANGLEVTALHNHFFWEQPRIFYMHIHGHGRAVSLAHQLKPALDLIGHVRPNDGGSPARPTTARATSATAPSSRVELDTDRIAQIVGHPGETLGSVYKITLGRDDLKVVEMGAAINARMGLNTWAAFVGSDQDAVVAGDVAMLEGEVPPVLKALRQNGIDVVALHQHMLSVRPTVLFLHYWGRGPAEKLATGFRAALEELGRHGRAPALRH